MVREPWQNVCHGPNTVKQKKKFFFGDLPWFRTMAQRAATVQKMEIPYVNGDVGSWWILGLIGGESFGRI